MVSADGSEDIWICFFGDSLVNGAGDTDCLGWTGRVSAEARRRGHDVTHYNLGVRGDTSTDIAARWLSEATRRLEPRYRVISPAVVFSFGVNDTVVMDGALRVPLEQSIENATGILANAKARFPVLMVGPPPVADASRHPEIVDLSDHFRAICESEEVPYLDVFERLRASTAWMREVASRDGAHPDSNGYQALAELVQLWDSWQELLVP